MPPPPTSFKPCATPPGGCPTRPNARGSSDKPEQPPLGGTAFADLRAAATRSDYATPGRSAVGGARRKPPRVAPRHRVPALPRRPGGHPAPPRVRVAAAAQGAGSEVPLVRAATWHTQGAHPDRGAAMAAAVGWQAAPPPLPTSRRRGEAAAATGWGRAALGRRPVASGAAAARPPVRAGSGIGMVMETRGMRLLLRFPTPPLTGGHETAQCVCADTGSSARPSAESYRTGRVVLTPNAAALPHLCKLRRGAARSGQSGTRGAP